MDTVEGGVNLMTELFTKVTPVVTSLLEVVTDVITWGLDNPIILLGFAGGIVALAVGIFRSVREAI